MKRFAASAIALVLSASASVGAWAIPPASHAYGFDGNVVDELGGPDMVPVLGTIHPTNLRFHAGGGASVTGAVASATYSIEMRFRVAAVTSYDGWVRLINFKNGTADQGLYIENGYLAFYTDDIYLSSQPLFVAGKVADLVVTRDGATGQLDCYLDGVLQLSVADTSGDAVFASPDGVHTVATFFLDDSVYGNEDSAGLADHIRIFDTVLTQADAQALARGRLPPNVTQH